MMTRVNKNATALCVAVFSEYLVQDANQQVDSGQTAEPHAVSSDIEPSTNEPPTVSCDQASEHEMQQAETQHQHLVADNVPLSNLLNQFVIVLYEGNPYPGKVIDVDEQQGDLQISCMHRIGPNRFFWPSKTDICWYEHDNIISVIPEPAKVTHRHCEVSPLIWSQVMIN